MVSITRVFKLGIKVAEWATPRVKEWHKQRHLNRVEGQRHLGSRNWTEAEKHLALALNESHHSAARRIELMLDLESAQRHQGKLEQAEQTALAAVGSAIQLKDHVLHSQCLGALLDVQLAGKKFSEAEKTAEAITQLENSQSKPDHGRLAQCSRKLGVALFNGGRNQEAMQAFQRAAKLSEQVFGENHAETADSLTEVGKLLAQTGEHAEAQRYLRRALEIHRKLLGKNSPEAAQDLACLASSLAESGDLDSAVGEYERVLAMFEQQIGGDRIEKAETQVRLAALYVYAGRPAPARELLTHAIGVLDRKPGPVLALALESMACADEQVGRNEDAQRWRDKAAKLAVTQAG